MVVVAVLPPPLVAESGPKPLFEVLEKVGLSESLSAEARAEEDAIWQAGVLQREYATVDLAALEAIAESGQGTILMNMFADAVYEVRLEYSVDPRLRVREWRGDVRQIEGSYVLLTQPWARTSVGVAGGAAIDRRKFRIRRLETLPNVLAIEEIDETVLTGSSDDGE